MYLCFAATILVGVVTLVVFLAPVIWFSRMGEEAPVRTAAADWGRAGGLVQRILSKSKNRGRLGKR